MQPPACVLRDEPLVVRRDQHGDAHAVELDEDVDDAPRRLGVEVRGGLVGEEDRGPIHDRTRNREALLLAGLLAAALVAVTFNTIRLQILTQREEIEVSKLLGATDAFVRRPFYYAGLLQGLAGGVIALALVYGSLAFLNREMAPLAAAYGSDFRLAFLGSGDALALLALAGILGWLGAHLSIGRHLLDI